MQRSRRTSGNRAAARDAVIELFVAACCTPLDLLCTPNCVHILSFTCYVRFFLCREPLFSLQSALSDALEHALARRGQAAQFIDDSVQTKQTAPYHFPLPPCASVTIFKNAPKRLATSVVQMSKLVSRFAIAAERITPFFSAT